MSTDPHWLNKLGQNYYFNQDDEDIEPLEDLDLIEKEIEDEEEWEE